MSLTLVTMLFDINKRHDFKRRSVEEYLEWGKSVLNLKYDMVVYCEADLVDKIKGLRTLDAKTEIIPMLFEELPQFKHINDIKRGDFPLNSTITDKNYLADLITMWWSKPQLIKSVGQNNLFNSTHVAYIDFGIAHCINNWFAPEPFIILPDKVKFHILKYIDREYIQRANYRMYLNGLVAGNYIIGSINQINILNIRFEKEIARSLGTGYISVDEDLFARIIVNTPEDFLYSYGDYANIFTNYDGVHCNLGHIGWMMADARERKGWQFVCDLGAEVLKNYNNGTLQCSGNELEWVLFEYFIGAYWANKIDIATEIAYLYCRLLDMDHNFYYAYSKKTKAVQSNFSFLPNPPKLPWSG